MKLTKEDRNLIYRAVAVGKLDPRDCNLTIDKTRYAIRHHPGSVFVVALSPFLILPLDRYFVGATVNDGSRKLFRTSARLNDEILNAIAKWAAEVKKVTEAPDLWTEIQRSGDLVTEIQQEAVANTPFTQEEQEQIAVQLEYIKEQIREQFELTSEQIAKVYQRLDEATEASKRMGRKDWLLIFSGTIFTVIVTDIVTPGVAEHIFITFIHALGHLFTGGHEPPQIPPHTLA